MVEKYNSALYLSIGRSNIQTEILSMAQYFDKNEISC